MMTYDVEVLFKDSDKSTKHFKCDEIEFEDDLTLLLSGITKTEWGEDVDKIVAIPNAIIHHLIAERVDEPV